MKLSESIQGFMVPIGARQTSAGNGCGWNLGCQQREGLHLIARRYPWELADGLQCPSMPPAPGLCATRQALIRNRVRSAASTRSRHALRWFGSRTISALLLLATGHREACSRAELNRRQERGCAWVALPGRSLPGHALVPRESGDRQFSQPSTSIEQSKRGAHGLDQPCELFPPSTSDLYRAIRENG